MPPTTPTEAAMLAEVGGDQGSKRLSGITSAGPSGGFIQYGLSRGPVIPRFAKSPKMGAIKFRFLF